jgi:hypothetical protein
MEFRDYAASETSALFGRLLSSHSDAAVQQLRSLREALDSATQALETGSVPASQVEKQVQELARKLNAAATAEVQRVQLESKSSLEAARAELKTHQAQTHKLTSALQEAKELEDALRADLRREAERAEAADRDLEETIEAHKQVDAARMEAEAECKRETAARAAIEQELRDFRALLESTRAEASRRADQLEAEAAQNAIMSEELNEIRGEREALARQLESIAEDRQAVSSRLETAINERDAMFAQLEDARNERDAIAGQREDARNQRDAVASELEDSRNQRDALAAQLEDSRNERDAIAAQLDASSREREAIAAQLDASNRERDVLAVQLEALSAERELMAARLEAIGREHDEASAQIDLSNAEREALAAELAATRARAEAFEREQANGSETVRELESRLNATMAADAAVRDQFAQADGHATRLALLLYSSVRAVEELGQAKTIADLLGGLVKQMSAEFPRVALFRVKGSHVEGDHQVGFDVSTDVTKLMIPFNVESLITRAATSGAIQQLADGSAAGNTHAPFGGAPAAALALPIGFQGETLAVVYAECDEADNGTSPTAYESSAQFATLLVRHTTALVTRLTQELKTMVELRDYATMLLQEAEQMHNADVEAGKPENERQRRLKETVDCAKQLYAQRAAMEGPAAAGLLDEQILSAVEANPETAFSQELAAVCGHQTQQQRKQARKTAS